MAGALMPMIPSLSFAAEQSGYRLLELDGYRVKWGEPRLGASATVSYAFATSRMHFQNARNCSDLAPADRLAEHADIPLEALQREAAAAFRQWEQIAGVSFREVGDPGDADIIIGSQARPRGRAFANVTYAPGAVDRVKAIEQALVCLNPEYAWKIGFDGDTDVYDIRYTLMHEIGHAIGLDHPGPSGQVMGFRYQEGFDHLQPGDRRGARRLYGPGAVTAVD
jgi:hypothetical protein